ncbi:MAG: hypothetical protein ACI8W8_004472 [Rhodothermales bacterium]|jgi:hypothetical protein
MSATEKCCLLILFLAANFMGCGPDFKLENEIGDFPSGWGRSYSAGVDEEIFPYDGQSGTIVVNKDNS